MSRCEDISNTIWDDPDFEPLSAHAALLYIWSWTNPRCDMAGIYRVSLQRMTESKVPADAIVAALDELAAAGFAFYEDQVLWVRARVKRLRSRSPQMAKAVAKDLRRIPAAHPLRQRFLDEYADDPWLRTALTTGLGEGMGNLSEKPIGKGDSHRFPVGSTEPPGKGEVVVVSSSGKTELPKEFPGQLKPHLRTIYSVLRDLAVRHNAKAVVPLSLVSVVMARQHKPLVRGAYDFAAWCDGQAQQRKDVVAGYRNWLDKMDDLAGFEQLGDAGQPVAGAPVRNAGGSSGGMNASEMMRSLGLFARTEPSAAADPGSVVTVSDVDILEDTAA